MYTIDALFHTREGPILFRRRGNVHGTPITTSPSLKPQKYTPMPII